MNGASDFDIPPLKKEDVKSMYALFEENMSPTTVIAKLGGRPDIVQNEYQRFLSMKLRDPFELQNRIVSGLSRAPPEIQSIMDKSVAGNLLTNNELITVINYNTTVSANNHIKNAVSPYGLERVVCKYCHLPQPGMIFDRTTYAGSSVLPISNNYLCQNCLKLAEQTINDYQRSSNKL
jgi:hypothetical protein